MISPPQTFAVLEDVNERVQTGDMIYDPDDLEWYYATRKQVGSYIGYHTIVARTPDGVKTKCVLAPMAATVPTVKRVLRSRAQL
jgi:hypothetical protein